MTALEQKIDELIQVLRRPAIPLDGMTAVA
jgi:hypothetical protein